MNDCVWKMSKESKPGRLMSKFVNVMCPESCDRSTFSTAGNGAATAMGKGMSADPMSRSSTLKKSQDRHLELDH